MIPDSLVLQAGNEAVLIRQAARVLGLTLAGGGVALVAALCYRWYAGDRIPAPLAVLLSLGVVAVFLNTDPTDALREVMVDERDVFETKVLLLNVVAFAAASAAAPIGASAGDRFGASLFAVSGRRAVEGEVGRLVRTVGRVVVVTLPEELRDMEGYDPASPETKAELAGKTLLFPRRLTVAELHDRVVTRLKDDYEVGHVDLELADDGTVEYLAVGGSVAGLGPTLPPGTVATAIHADPPFAASPGDRVQVWRPGDPPERVATAELRATAGDVATLALDETDAAALDDATRYRLLTLPASPSAEQEFAGLLRAADETMEAVTVAPGGDLAGAPVGALDATVVAVRSAGQQIEALPDRTRTLSAGDVVYVVARPETLRRVAAAGQGSGATGSARPDGADPA